MVGEEVEFDAIDVGAISDSDIVSITSSSVASVEHLRTVPTNANQDDDSLFKMGDTIFRQARPPDSYIFDLIVSIELSYFAVRSEVPGDGNCGYYSIMNVLIRHFRRVCPDHPCLKDELSGVSFAKATWFRQMIHEYVSREAESLFLLTSMAIL